MPQKLTIDEMKELASLRGGKCLSKSYTNSRTHLEWECTEGHRWMARPDNIKYQSQWCPYCAGVSKRTIEDMHSLAKKRGGKCLSSNYINARTKLLWECAKGHQWKAKPNDIQQGRWCLYCAGKVRLTIELMRQIASERGGKCLSKKYINNSTKLLWECAEGHQWKAKPNSVQQGTWCTTCSSGLGERICREFFKQIFKKPFPKSYPFWLKNQRNNQMELDGYCEDLKIAFEHHGGQHYSSDSLFIRNDTEFDLRKSDDKYKRELCNKHGVKLIEVPEVPRFLPVSEIKPFLFKECSKNGIELPKNYEQIKIDLKRAYSTPFAKEALQTLRKIAVQKGGRLISSNYINNFTKLLWECAKGHRWEAVPNSVQQGKWCAICSDRKKLSIEMMRQIAQERGGKCLSEIYANNHTKLLWECAKGHRWEAVPKEVKNRNSWCPHCSGKNKKTIGQMQELAAKRGGKCLTETYVNISTKILWECSKGHQWWAKPGNIIQGKWCPKCGGTKKLTLEHMHKLAQFRDGKCLSHEYLDNKTKLLWECSNGHQWMAAPYSIKQGKWCPHCYRQIIKKTKKSNQPQQVEI